MDDVRVTAWVGGHPIALSELRPLLFAGREQDRRRIVAEPDADIEEYLWWCQHTRSESVVGFADLPVDVQRGPADIYRSMLAGNPPERLAERAARWRGSPYPPEAD